MDVGLSVDGVTMQVKNGVRSYTGTRPYADGTAKVTVNVLADLLPPHDKREYAPGAYNHMLKSILRGIAIRSFFFGYDSEVTQRYVKASDRRRWTFEEHAGREIDTRENLSLRGKLVLRIKPLWSLT